MTAHINSNDVSRQLGSLLELLDRKRAQPSNSDLETRFFSDVLEFLLNDSTDHWWCTEIQPITEESLWFFSLPDHENINKYKEKLAIQLRNCTLCLQHYYAAKPALKKRYNQTFSPENVKSFFDTLDRFDRHRVMTTLRRSVYTQSAFVLTNDVTCAIYDILSAPQLLHENDCDTLFCNLFNEMQRAARFPTFGTEVANGIAVLTFHHHRVVRTWARKLLDRFISDGFLLDTPDISVRMAPRWLASPPSDLVTDMIRITGEVGERTKAFRVTASLLTPDKLKKIMDSTTPSIQQWIVDLLAKPGSNVQETIRCMTVLLQKLDQGFWGEDVFAVETHRGILKRICDDQAFQAAMTIAKEETAGNIKQRDGTAYPQDKLIARIKGMVEWIYLYWSALPQDAQDQVTGNVLDLLWGYFQLNTWAINCRAYCAELGFRVVQESTARDKCPYEKVNQYAAVVLQFSSAAGIPEAFQHLHEQSSSILAQLLRQDAMDLRERIIALSQKTTMAPRIGCESLWAAIDKLHDYDAGVLIAVIQGYSQLVIVDIPFSDSTQSTDGRLLMQYIQKIRQILGRMLNNISSQDMMNLLGISKDMRQSVLELMCSPHAEIRSTVMKLTATSHIERLSFSHFFEVQPRNTLKGFTTILDNFSNLAMPLDALDSFKLVAPLNLTLAYLMDTLVGDQHGYMKQLVDVGDYDNEEYRIIKDFWNTCWRTMGLIFGSGMKWSETHKPKEVVDSISTLLDTAQMMMGARQLFQKAVASSTPVDGSFDDASQLQYDHVNQAIDSLSHWVYVTRPEVIRKLIPLLILMLKHLSQMHIKVSAETYERLMSAATGVDDTRLSEKDKETLFIALSAHQPANTIFIDDSDDELEWQLVEPQLSASPARPTKSASEKITSYFTKTDADPMFVDHPAPDNVAAEDINMDEDDEFYDDFGDLDISALPDEFFDVHHQTPIPEPSSTPAAPRKSIASAIQKQQTELWKQHEALKAKEDAERQRLKQQQQLIQEQRQRRQQATFQPKAPTEKPAVYAVTSSGRKLRAPPAGFSKLRALREEFRAERKMIAASKSPSAAAIARKDADSSSGSDTSDDDDDGLLGLVNDNNKRAIEEERASVKELFAQPVKRSTKLIETHETKVFMQKRQLIKQAHQRRKRVTPDIDRFLKAILSWDITANTEMPPGAFSGMYKQVYDSYDSYQDYLMNFEPLLLLEVWVQLLRARETLTENEVIDRCVIDSRCHVNDFVDVTFRVTLSSVNSLMTDDLVCVANHFGNDFFKRDEVSYILAEPKHKPSSYKGRMFIGKVMSMTQRKSVSEVTIRCYFSPDRIILLNSLSPKTTWNILRLASITTAQREYAALQGLEHYDLVNDVLQPKPAPMPMISDQAIHKCIDKYGVNEPQAQAILGALYKKQGFTLIQGPPGTGKTKTILGLIVSLLDEQRDRNRMKERGVRIDNSSVYGGEGKILVCAPSNAAVDEIAKRLQDGIMTSHGLCKPNVVRIGTPEAANASVRELLLDRLVEKELASTIDNADQAKDFSLRRSQLSEDIRKVQLDIDDTDRQIAECKGADMTKIPELRQRKTSLVAQRNKYKYMIKGIVESQRDFTREQDISKNRARQKVFANADIVCATLSGSGNEMLTSMALSFETVIVDEAAQSVEISSLIPLKYDCKRCILVGDPNQLPPTVLSQMAAKYSYEQSLFMRLQKGAPDNVYLLSIQYRMHPEISSFPSKLFYSSRLLNGPDMETITAAPWHSQHYFPPYRFYNVEQGSERMGYGKSLYNPSEADAALALVDMLANNLPQVKLAYRIGIITPYKQQLSHLKHKFEGRYGPKILDVIDFNTVDGFQGQEKDIIIFSCVRAMSERGIGFLADMRRMNVGLTRAKSSLFVLGHKVSLMQSQLWGDLVKDAIQRGRIEDIRQPYFNHRLIANHRPSNLFDKEDKPMAVVRKPLARNKAQRIAIPDGKRSRTSSPIPHEAPQTKRIRTTSNVSLPVPQEVSLSKATVAAPDAREVWTEEIPQANKARMTPERIDNKKKDAWTPVIPFTTNKLPEDNNSQKKPSIGSPSRPSSSTPSKASTSSRPTTPSRSSTPRSSTSSRPSTPSRPMKMTLAQYRSTRGLPPNVQASHERTSSGGSNLYIQKRKAPAQPSQPTNESDDIGARDKVILQHQAAKDAMRQIRLNEQARQQKSATQHHHPAKSMDDLLHDIHQRRR